MGKKNFNKPLTLSTHKINECFKLSDEYYTNLTEFMFHVKQMKLSRSYQRRKKGGYYVYNVPTSFDIETSSFYNANHEKQVTMYVWQFCFNGSCLIGRTWQDFIRLLHELQKTFCLNEENRLYVYVHNLSYEFQFMRKWLTWSSVFSVDIRKPIKALTDLGIEFRDSYILSGYSLEMTANQLHKYKVQKQVGLLDYNKIRLSTTRLTHDEMKYCIYDVLVVVAYIEEQMEEYGNITKIPLTNTGRVRNFCREHCYHGWSKDENIRKQTQYDYTALMKTLTLQPKEYLLWKQAFQGGFTHGNPAHIQQLLRDVASFDFTSSYPYVMLSEKFPMGKGFQVNIKDLSEYNLYNENFFMVFECRLTNVEPKIFADNPISVSRCIKCSSDAIINNGRVVYADEIILACTNVDLAVYSQFYNFTHFDIANCWCYAMDYLPKNFILAILKLYNDKTKLKGVKGKEREYLHSKGMLNSCYGMSVTDIVRDILNYIDDWEEPEKADIEEQIEKYNKNKSRFLFYPWGCAVTSYSRRNLFTAIAECNQDYIYSDTDSVKILNKDKHIEYFEAYNKNVEKKLKAVSEYYNIPFELFKPKTIKGVEKLIGVWDYEGTYTAFKTLGAKRYMYYDGELHTTIAGVSKQGAVDYLKAEYHNYRHKKLHGKNVSRETFIQYVFKKFDNQLHIPSEYSGKLTHTYIDDEMEGVVADCYGKIGHYKELSGVHLSQTDFNISMSIAFLNFLKGVRYECQI